MNPSLFANSALLLLLLGGALAVWPRLLRTLLSRSELVAFTPREPVPWSGFEVLGLVLAMVLFDGISLAFWSQSLGVNIEGNVDTTQELTALFAANCVSRVFTLIFAVGFLLLRGATADDLGFDVFAIAADLRLGLKAFLAGALFIYALMAYLTRWFPYEHPVIRLMTESPDPRLLLLCTFSATLAAPLVEEFFFRVLVQGWLEGREERLRQTGVDLRLPAGLMPVLISSLLFAAMHLGNGPDPLPLFELSLLLGYLYYRTHRIWPSLVVHFCLNAYSMAQLWLASAGGST